MLEWMCSYSQALSEQENLVALARPVHDSLNSVTSKLMSKWLDPLTRERIDHLVMGLACIAATALAVGASLVIGLLILRQSGGQ